MIDLTPITALGASMPVDRRFGPLRIVENSELGLASLALHRGTETLAPFGLTLPGPGERVARETVSIFWIGPNQWMVEGEGRATDDFASALADEAPGCSITEQTDGWTAFEITSDAGGASIQALMEKLVNIDATTFTPGSATRTGLHHMTVFLIRRADERLAIIGSRSMAAALWHALEETAGRLTQRK